MINKTVGPGGDYTTWGAAIQWLNTQTPLADDYTFTQIASIASESIFNTLAIDMGGYTVLFTNNNFDGRPLNGNRIGIGSTTLTLFNLDQTNFKNGTLIIEKLSLYTGAGGIAGAFKLRAMQPDTHVKIRNVLFESGSSGSIGVDPLTYGFVYAHADLGGDIEGFNINICTNTGSTGCRGIRTECDDLTSHVLFENCTIVLYSSTGQRDHFIRVDSTVGPITFRNCYAEPRGTSTGSSFAGVNNAQTWGYNCASVDASAGTFGGAGSSGNQTGLLADAEFGSLQSHPSYVWASCVPRKLSILHTGGMLPTIPENTHGLRGAVRPSGGGYSIGAIETGDHRSCTVGSGGDYATITAAKAALWNVTNFGGDVTVTLVSDVVESNAVQLGIYDMCNWKIRLTSDTPHGGRWDQGHQLTIPVLSLGLTLYASNGETECDSIRLISGYLNNYGMVKLQPQNYTYNPVNRQPGVVLFHDCIIRVPLAYQIRSGEMAVHINPSNDGLAKMWNNIIDVETSNSGLNTIEHQHSGTVKEIVENNIISIHNYGTATIGIRGVYSTALGPGGIYRNNFIAVEVLGAGGGVCFSGLTHVLFEGYNNAATDTTATLFGSQSGGLNNRVVASDFTGSDPDTPATYFVPATGSDILHSGGAPGIAENVEGIRGGSRPHGILYSIGAVEATFAGFYSVGTGQDFPTWKDAIASIALLPGPFGGNATFRQFGDTVETVSPSAIASDFGGYTLTFDVDTPHGGDPSVGDKVTITGSGSSLFRFSGATNGQLVIRDLKVEYGASGAMKAFDLAPAGGSGAGLAVSLRDILHYCPDAYVAPDAPINIAASGYGSVEGWNIISDLPSAAATISAVKVAATAATSSVKLENVVSQYRNASGNACHPFNNAGATGPITLRNCYAHHQSIGNGFNAFDSGDTYGYNNGSTDSTATSFITQAGGQNGLVTSTEFIGSLYTTPSTYFVTVAGSTVANGGNTPTITGNTAGIRGNPRPHGSYVSIGATESLPVIASGLHTIGTGADWPDWQQAMASLVTPTGDITLRQVNDCVQPTVARLPSNLFNLAGYKLTLESDTPHEGRSDQGWRTRCTDANGCLDLSTNSFQNGEVEIKDLRIEMRAAEWRRAISVVADDSMAATATAKVHDILVFADFAYQLATGVNAIELVASNGGSNAIDMWNTILDMPRPFFSTSSGIAIDVSTSGCVIRIENTIVQTRDVGPGSIKCFNLLGTVAGAAVYVRNCMAGTPASPPVAWFTGFHNFTSQAGDVYGRNNISSDATATLFDTESGGNNNQTLVPDCYMGENYGFADTYMVPHGTSPALDGGSAPDIVANTTGIRGHTRPHGGLYSIGAVEALVPVSKTVGSGGDYATWNAALAWLATQLPLLTNHTLTQISAVTESVASSLLDADLGTFNLRFTSDSPHQGRGNHGWDTESHSDGVQLQFKNGTFEVDNLKLLTSGTGWTRLLRVQAYYNSIGNVHDLLAHGPDGHVSAGAAFAFEANGGILRVWNVISDVLSDTGGGALPTCTMDASDAFGTYDGFLYVENSNFVNRQVGAGAWTVSYGAGTGEAYLRNVVAINRGVGGGCFDNFDLGTTEGRNCASTDGTASDFGVASSPYLNIDTLVEFDSTDYTDDVNYFVPVEDETLDDGGVAPAISDNANGIRGNPRPHIGGLYAVGAVEIATIPNFDVTGTVEGVVTLGGTLRLVTANKGTPEQRAEELGYRPSTPIRVYTLDVKTVSDIVAAQVADGGHFCMSQTFLGGPGDPLFDAGAKPGYIGTKNGSLYAFRAPTEKDVVWHVEKTLDGDLVDHKLYRWQTGSDLHWAPYQSWPERAIAGTRVFDQLDPDKVYDYYGRLMGATMTQWNLDNKTILTFIDPDDCPEKFLPHLANNVGARLRADEDEGVQRERIKNAVPISKAKSLALAVVIRLQELGYEGYANEVWVNVDNPANYSDDLTGQKGTDFIEVEHGSRKDDVFIGYRFLGALNPSSGDSIEIDDYTTQVVFSFGAGPGTVVAIGADAWETLDNLIAAVVGSALTMRARKDFYNEVEPTMILNGGKVLYTTSRTGQVHNAYYPSSRVILHINSLSGEPIDITKSEQVLDALKEDLARELGIDVFPVYTDIRYFVTDPEVGGDFGIGEALEIGDVLVLTEV